MKLSLRFSLLLNAILALAFVAALLFALWQDWCLASYKDGRPQGSLIVLTKDQPVFERINGSVVFTLPKGTTLQESTPHGAATLGKVNHYEYILVIHSDESYHGQTAGESTGWMDQYRFDVSK